MTPGLWRHRCRPMQFVLIVDDFDVEYVRKKDADHLAKTLKKYHTISQDWEGKKFSNIDLTWTYAPNHADRTCRLSMKNYITNLLVALNHPAPKKKNTAVPSPMSGNQVRQQISARLRGGHVHPS